MSDVDNVVAMADAEYALCKSEAKEAGKPHAVTLSIIECRHGLKRRKLRNYRANHYAPSRQRRTTTEEM